MELVIERTGNASGAVVIGAVNCDGTATAGEDYPATSVSCSYSPTQIWPTSDSRPLAGVAASVKITPQTTEPRR